MVSFTALKKKNSLASLHKAIESSNTKASFKDARFWEPTVDKAGNATCIIRFLPAPGVDGDDAPDYIEFFEYYFKGPTGDIYRNMSLQSIGQKDPVNEYYFKLRKPGTEESFKRARPYTRKQKYVANIYVVKDPGNPANEGKVFLYKFGTKIKEKIDAASGRMPDGTPIDDSALGDDAPIRFSAFGLDEGANFELVVKRVMADKVAMPNYDSSKFRTPSPFLGGDASKQEAVWKQEYSLAAEVAPTKFKTYEELKKELESVLGFTAGSAASTGPRNTAASEEAGDVSDDTSPSHSSNTGETSEEFDDEDLTAFKNLMKS